MTPSQIDCSERSALVTGANSGLGFEAARQLAEMGYGSVVLACRTAEKGEAARSELRSTTGKDPFSIVAMDVADVASSSSAARTWGRTPHVTPKAGSNS